MQQAPSSDKLGVERAGSAEAEHRAKARGCSALPPAGVLARESRRAGNGGRAAPPAPGPGSGPAHAGLPAGEPTCFLKEIKGSAPRTACIRSMPMCACLLAIRWDLHLGDVDRVGCSVLALVDHGTLNDDSLRLAAGPGGRACHALRPSPSRSQRFGRAGRPANMHRGGLAARMQDLRTHGTARRSVRHRAAGDV